LRIRLVLTKTIKNNQVSSSMGYLVFPSNEPSNYYENLPSQTRKELEAKLVHLKDEEAARNSLSAKINARTNSSRFPGVFSFLQPIVISGGFLTDSGRPTIPEYWVDIYNLEKSKTPECLDIHVATHAANREEIVSTLRDFEIPFQDAALPLCDIPICPNTSQGMRIPLTKTKIILPDEDGYSEEEIVPELRIHFLNHHVVLRQFIHFYYSNSDGKDPHWWAVINTCPEHSNSRTLREYIQPGSRRFLRSLPPETIVSSREIKRPKGIEIEFPI
jgi:hypothetical protein